MKTILLTLLISCFSQTNIFGQLIISGSTSIETIRDKVQFQVDTLSQSGDSIFVIVSKFEKEILTYKEEQIFVQSKVREHRVVFNGLSEQWYPNGMKKSEGKLKNGEKVGLWKYWDKRGNLTQDIDADAFGRGRGSSSGFIFIDGEKVMKRKNQ